jgi:RsiW-degrading membrane proteinase PrsW (M82 family)
MVLIGVVFKFGRVSLPEDLLLRARQLGAANMPAEAEPVFEAALSEDINNLELHSAYIRNHFAIPNQSDKPRDDQKLVTYYQALQSKPETLTSGYFGMGLLALQSQDYQAALDNLKEISEQDIKNVNFFIGLTFLKLGKQDLAEQYLWQEIKLQGNLGDAVATLADQFSQSNRMAELRSLANDPIYGKYVAQNYLRTLALADRDWLEYLRLIYIVPYQRMTLEGFLGGMIICLVWMIYLLRIAVFRQRPFYVYLITFLLGIFFTMSSIIVSDIVGSLLPIESSGRWWLALSASVIHIGVIEEVIKFIPVLIVILFVQRDEEPFDLMLVGTLSALGFATLENVMYFSLDGLGLTLSRYLYSTIVHISMTGIVCYAWIRVRYFRPTNQILGVLGGLALAAFVHGAFDYFLFGPYSRITGISLMIALVLAREYHRMISNSLNASPFFYESASNSSRLKNFGLFLSAAFILMTVIFLQYNFDFSTEIAGKQLYQLSISTLPAAIAVVGSLGKLGLKRGVIIPLNNFTGVLQRLLASHLQPGSVGSN